MAPAPPPAPPARPSRLARAGWGIAFAAAVLLGVEAFWHAVGGDPPMPRGLIRVATARLEVDGDTATLRHAELPQQDVVVPTRPGERPRVVFLGESSVRHAWTSPPEVNFPTHVQALLPDVEVVNFGMPGQSAGGILRLASELAPLRPDLVVIYTGHNEFNAPVFRGEVEGVRLWTLPFHELLARSWIRARLAQALLPPGDTTGVMHAPPTPGKILPVTDDALLRARENVLARLENELGRAVEASPAPVMLATLLRNFDHPPSGVLVAGHPDCASVVADAPTTAPADPGRWAETVAAACGEDAALAAWYRAHALRREGRDAEAAEAWARSLARDPVSIRAPLEADAVTRKLAAASGATLVDLAAAVPFPEGALFDDMLHPSRAGATRIAELLAPEIRAALARVPTDG